MKLGICPTGCSLVGFVLLVLLVLLLSFSVMLCTLQCDFVRIVPGPSVDHGVHDQLGKIIRLCTLCDESDEFIVLAHFARPEYNTPLLHGLSLFRYS